METYALGRECWDADSHIMETPEFLSEFAESKYKDSLYLGGGELGGEAFSKFFEDMISQNRARLSDAEKTAELETNVIGGAKGWAAHGAFDKRERSRTMDLLGFRGQLVFSTFAISSFIRATDLDLMYAGVSAHNRAIANFCADDKRLLGVAFIPLLDPDRAISALKEAVALGCSAIQIPSDAPGGNEKGFSPAHKHLDVFWQKVEESRLPIMLHIGGGKLLPKAYHNNGHPKPKDWLGGGENLRGKDFHSVSHSPENFLAALTLDGIFDRHPGINCGVIELGASWVPGFLRNLDNALRFAKSEPIIKSLSMSPADFIRRQVKFTPFNFEDIGWLIEQEGEDLFLFSSDYPHPEGGRNPIERFDESLEKCAISNQAREKFYANNFKKMMNLG